MRRRRFPTLAVCAMLIALMFLGTVVEKWVGSLGDVSSSSRF